jgi:hypothetical protein
MVRVPFYNDGTVMNQALRAVVTGIWGDYSEYYSANVTGTRNVIDATVSIEEGLLRLRSASAFR